MKHDRNTVAVTSLPQAPQAEANRRVRRYAITMTIRIVCFALMALITPYGWYTWVFGAAAAFLPYVAVVFANAGSDSTEATAESPLVELEAPLPPAAEQNPTDPTILTIHENRRSDDE